MVALTVGLLVVGGLMTIFVQSSRTNREITKIVQQMENGRFAMQLLREDLWHAGYWGEFNPYPTAPTAMPPICSSSSWADPTDTEVIKEKDNFLRVPVIGSNDEVPNGCEGVVTNRKSGTDVLIVRHASLCIADPDPYTYPISPYTNGNCENFNTNKLYLQVSLCKDDYNISQPETLKGYYLSTDPNITDQPPFTFRMRDNSRLPAPGKSCTDTGYTTTYAGRRKVLSNLYYIRDDNTLRRSELYYDDNRVKQKSAETLVEGIEYLKFLYGVDSDDNGSADSFVSTPADAAAWSNVVAVKVYLLARALEQSPGYDDSKVYQVGPKRLQAGTDLPSAYKRHVYSAYVRLVNPAGRREKP